MLNCAALSPQPHAVALSARFQEFNMFRLFIAATVALLCTAALAQAPKTEGEVTKIDKAQARITLRHAEIKSLEMPAMTMVFRVRDAKLLDGVTVGDKVRFDAAKVDGYYTVTALTKAP
jgi:Cu(I)/Ag(I) efflux system periplasmic protein CusF